MSIQAISFGHKHPLKTLFKKGQFPQVKKGFYGENIDGDTVSLEHLQPVSKGGKTTYGNLVLANKHSNSLRGNSPLGEFINFKAMGEYLAQFVDVKVQGFDGNKYIAGIVKKVGTLLGGVKK